MICKALNIRKGTRLNYLEYPSLTFPYYCSVTSKLSFPLPYIVEPLSVSPNILSGSWTLCQIHQLILHVIFIIFHMVFVVIPIMEQSCLFILIFPTVIEVWVLSVCKPTFNILESLKITPFHFLPSVHVLLMR